MLIGELLISELNRVPRWVGGSFWSEVDCNTSAPRKGHFLEFTCQVAVSVLCTFTIISFKVISREFSKDFKDECDSKLSLCSAEIPTA